MTNETTASERERFETFARQVPANLERLESGPYVSSVVNFAWRAWQARAALPAPADQVLVPKRLTRAMREVLDEEGWTWEDLLAAAEAITEAEYSELQAAPADQPTSQEPQGSSGSLSESGAEAGTQDAASELESFVRDLLWGAHPECCGCPVVGAEYMGQQEMICCGEPEYDKLSDSQIVASLRERFPERHCAYCGGNDEEPQDHCMDCARPQSSEPSADAAVVSTQHGASDNSGQDQQ